MNPYIIVLRIIHIFAGFFWVGAAATFVLFISPSAGATQPESQRFMTYLTQNLGFLNRTRDVAGLNVLAGLLLYSALYQERSGPAANRRRRSKQRYCKANSVR